MRLTTILNSFTFFIIIIKIAFLLSAIGNAITSRSDNINVTLLQPKFKYWKDRTEFIFVISMALLLIIYFRPNSGLVIPKSSRFLFFLFGIVLLFTANWDLFITESHWFKQVSATLGLN